MKGASGKSTELQLQFSDESTVFTEVLLTVGFS